MKVNSVKSPSFGAIIDPHTHDGHWWVGVDKKTFENFSGQKVRTQYGYSILKDLTCDVFEIANNGLGKNSPDKVEKIITSNLDCMVRNHPQIENSTITSNGTPFLKDELSGNMEMLQNNANPNTYFYATCQPKYGDVRNIEKLFSKDSKHRFVGLKFHPKQLDVRADDTFYDPYMKFAKAKGLPCLFHTQVNVKDASIRDCSDPRLVYAFAKRHPDVPVILGHTGAGGEIAHRVAIDVLKESIVKGDAKLYCDVSWVDFSDGLPSKTSESIVALIKELMDVDGIDATDRILFATDIPVGFYGETSINNLTPTDAYQLTVSNLKKVIKDNFADDAPRLTKKIFYENANKLFFENVKQKSKKSIFGVVLGVVFALSALYFAKNSKKNETKLNQNKNQNFQTLNIPTFSQFMSTTK